MLANKEPVATVCGYHGCQAATFHECGVKLRGGNSQVQTLTWRIEDPSTMIWHLTGPILQERSLILAPSHRGSGQTPRKRAPLQLAAALPNGLPC